MAIVVNYTQAQSCFSKFNPFGMPMSVYELGKVKV